MDGWMDGWNLILSGFGILLQNYATWCPTITVVYTPDEDNDDDNSDDNDNAAVAAAKNDDGNNNNTNDSNVN